MPKQVPPISTDGQSEREPQMPTGGLAPDTRRNESEGVEREEPGGVPEDQPTDREDREPPAIGGNP